MFAVGCGSAAATTPTPKPSPTHSVVPIATIVTSLSPSTSPTPTPTPTPTLTHAAAPPPAPPAPSAPPPRAPPPPPASCYPLTNSGHCYEPGEYCRTADRGASGVAGDGGKIMCEGKNRWGGGTGYGGPPVRCANVSLLPLTETTAPSSTSGTITSAVRWTTEPTRRRQDPPYEDQNELF